MRKVGNRVGRSYKGRDRERDVPSIWCFSPWIYSHFSFTAVFAARKQGGRLFPNTVALNGLQACPSHCSGVRGELGPAGHPTSSSQPGGGTRTWAGCTKVISGFSRARLFNAKALLAFASREICSQLQGDHWLYDCFPMPVLLLRSLLTLSLCFLLPWDAN